MFAQVVFSIYIVLIHFYNCGTVYNYYICKRNKAMRPQNNTNTFNMKQLAKIIKVTNSLVYHVEIYDLNKKYLETVYSRRKIDAKMYCKKINAKII